MKGKLFSPPRIVVFDGVDNNVKKEVMEHMAKHYSEVGEVEIYNDGNPIKDINYKNEDLDECISMISDHNLTLLESVMKGIGFDTELTKESHYADIIKYDRRKYLFVNREIVGGLMNEVKARLGVIASTNMAPAESKQLETIYFMTRPSFISVTTATLDEGHAGIPSIADMDTIAYEMAAKIKDIHYDKKRSVASFHELCLLYQEVNGERFFVTGLIP